MPSWVNEQCLAGDDWQLVLAADDGAMTACRQWRRGRMAISGGI